MEELKATFFQRYANIPAGAREEIIAVVDDETYTWNSAKVEIINNTETGKKILELLNKMKIL